MTHPVPPPEVAVARDSPVPPEESTSLTVAKTAAVATKILNLECRIVYNGWWYKLSKNFSVIEGQEEAATKAWQQQMQTAAPDLFKEIEQTIGLQKFQQVEKFTISPQEKALAIRIPEGEQQGSYIINTNKTVETFLKNIQPETLTKTIELNEKKPQLPALTTTPVVSSVPFPYYQNSCYFNSTMLMIASNPYLRSKILEDTTLPEDDLLIQALTSYAEGKKGIYLESAHEALARFFVKEDLIRRHSAYTTSYTSNMTPEQKATLHQRVAKLITEDFITKRYNEECGKPPHEIQLPIPGKQQDPSQVFFQIIEYLQLKSDSELTLAFTEQTFYQQDDSESLISGPLLPNKGFSVVSLPPLPKESPQQLLLEDLIQGALYTNEPPDSEPVAEQGQPVHKVTVFEQAPTVLYVDLPRTIPHNNRYVKVNTPVQVPLSLTLKRQSSPDGEIVDYGNYALESFVVHRGEEAQSGHFVTYYRQVQNGSATYWLCDDSGKQHHTVTQEEFLNAAAKGSSFIYNCVNDEIRIVSMSLMP